MIPIRFYYSLCFILLTTPAFAQSLQLSFRLYDAQQEIISPFRFESEVECYTQKGLQRGLVLQKRLKFDERSYHFLYQTEFRPGTVERLYFVLAEDTLVLQLAPLDYSNVVIDELQITQGLIQWQKEDFTLLEELSKPGRRSYTLWAAKLEAKAKEKFLSLPKHLERLRLSNFMQILHSRN